MKCAAVLLLYVTEVTCIEHSEAVMLSYSAFILVKVADEIRNGEGEIKLWSNLIWIHCHFSVVVQFPKQKYCKIYDLLLRKMHITVGDILKRS